TLLLSESLANAPLVFDSTVVGNGKTDFLFVLDQNGINEVNTTIFSNPNASSIRIALESTMTNVHGGPESFLALDPDVGGIEQSVTPEPSSILLTSSSLLALAALLRRKR